jgi:magnesium transporter
VRTVLTIDQGKIREGTLGDLKRRTCTWVHYWEPGTDELAEAASHVGVAVDELQELLAPAQRPTLRDTTNFSVVVVRSPRKDKEFFTKPVVLAVSKAKNDLVSLTPYHSRSIERIAALPDVRRAAIFAEGATSLLFTMLDEITASYFNVFERMDEQIDRVERNIRSTNGNESHTMETIYRLKKTLIYFHKALIGNREVVAGIEKAYAQFVDPKLLSKFRTLHDQLVQLVELDATYRDILTSTLEVHLSVISNAVNVTMKRVTSWGAIILIPSLIASVFGMNFDVIPIAHARFGFYGAIAVMVVATAGLYAYFKRKDWI